jgi:Protein of unknown function (DUF2934)
MPRKTSENTTTKRSKKADAPVPPSAIEVAPVVANEVRRNGRKNGTAAPLTLENVNIEEEIRRRAYELYLQRRATAGSGSGDENQDWLIAEREILSRLGDEHHPA